MPDLAQRFPGPDVQAIALLGSHARGNAGPFSNVDLVHFVAEEGMFIQEYLANQENEERS